MILRELTVADEAAFSRMLDEWDDLQFAFAQELGFEKYLSINFLDSEIPTTNLYAFVDDTIVGKVSIRHVMNSSGHIGYGVVDKYRGKGYGTLMLQEALEYARELKLGRVLLVCDEQNEASIKIIVKNGGVLESTSEKRMRFWIDV